MSYGGQPTKRRKQVTCCLCQKQETWNASGVCSTCTAHYEFGKRTAGRFQADGDLISVKIDRRLLPPKAYLGRSKKERREHYSEPFALDHALETAILDALGAQASFTGQGASSEVIDTLDTSRPHDRNYYAIMLPANKIPALTIFQIIADAMAAAYDDGRRDGENLLAKLAAGEVTVRQYEERKGK